MGRTPLSIAAPTRGMQQLATPRRAHLVGIAGCGMQSLARVLLDCGCRVTGSDVSPAGAAWLREAGASVAHDHAADNLPHDAEVVVYSDAVPEDVPERRLAARLGLPQLSYPEMLGAMMQERHGLAVAGTHGKSTTTAMTSAILREAGLDPTVVVGAAPLGEDTGGRAGRGDVMLVEACEFRRNFLHLSPRSAAILNIEADHFDCYTDLFDVESAFREFADTMPAKGYLAINADHASTRRLAHDLPCRSEAFGLSAGADWRAVAVHPQAGHYAFRIERYARELCEVQLAVPGSHQIHNALAAAALAWSAGARAEAIERGLASFRGLRRRLETVDTRGGVTLIDDYAHHPSEVTAALAAVRELCPNRKLWCIFQPHQALRTARLLDELAASLHNADVVAVAEIYRAREERDAAACISAADVAARIVAGGRDVLPWHRPADIIEHTSAFVRSGDVVVTLGAGDIRKVCDGIADRLGRHRAAG